MMQANIFICHNPFHVYISSQICKDKFGSDDFENLIISPTKTVVKQPGVRHMIASSGFMGKIIDLWTVKRKIIQLAKKLGPNLHIFLPHIDGVIGNYAFQAPLLKKKQVKINFFYEGIVMLDEKRMDREFPRFLGKKIFISLFIFHRFIKYPDILPMNSPRVFKIYTPYPEKTPAPSNRKERIYFKKEDFQKSEGRVLIVGVDAGESLRESTKSLLNFIRSDTSLKTIFFKPHYADRERVFEGVAFEGGFEYRLVSDTRCIEELIGSLNVDLVICTHLSSALLNLKLIYKDELRVVFLGHPKSLDALGAENLAFASSLGVEILDISQL